MSGFVNSFGCTHTPATTKVSFGLTSPTVTGSELANDTFVVTSDGTATGVATELWKFDAQTNAWVNVTIGSGTETVTFFDDTISGHKIGGYTAEDSTVFTLYETITALSFVGNTLTYSKEDGTSDTIDLSAYANLARVVSASLNTLTGIVTYTRSDATTFTLDLSPLLPKTDVVRYGTGAPVVLPTDVAGTEYLRTPSGTNATAATESYVFDGLVWKLRPSNLAPRFVGHLSANLTYPATTVTPIIVQTELFDALGEYNNTTGRFTPQTSGTYVYEMMFTSNNAGANTNWGTAADRMVFGVVSAATGLWISRYNFEPSVDDRAYFGKGVVALTAGVQYYFGIVGSNVLGGTIIANPTGATGTGIGTYFSFQRLI